MDELNQNGKGETEKEVNVSTKETALEPAEQNQKNEETEKTANEEIDDDMMWTISDDIKEEFVCPRCGKSFDASERHCPYCGLENNLKLCGTCGATIAKSAKRCPNCGAQEKAVPVEGKTLLVAAAIVIAAITVLFLAIKRNEERPLAATEMKSQSGAVGAYEIAPTLTSTPTPIKKPSTDDSSAGGGTMITVGPEDKPVLGTWEAYCYYDMSDESLTMASVAPEKLYFKLVVYSNNTGRIYTTYGSDTHENFDWNFLGLIDDKTRVYEASIENGSEFDFYYVNHDTDLGQAFGGMLAVYYDDLMIFLEKP